MRNIPETIKQLLVINILFFIGSQFLGGISNDLLALHYFKNDKFIFTQLFTHMFMHGNFYHILFNMFGLWMFGSPLEQMWGKRKFLFFYFSAGLGAAGLQLLAYHIEIQSVFSLLQSNGMSSQSFKEILSTGSYSTGILQYIDEENLTLAYSAYNSSLVGASGAIYGILVAFAFSFPNSELMLLFPPIPIKAKYLVPGLIVMDLFFGFSSYSLGPIAHFAHVGGAISGFLMVWYWKRNQFNNNRWN
ncbi:MAG: rhomboid family intramembrane serine protease [Flavobacteriaceae bacterium]|nr:rhomboid family intramembrane serine protease [Flavobacteriaceae bacterium]|tara:strand:- start:1358 stop:2095 length:738 start_codon:yes stop_codon:yes gene_type:complete